MLFAWNSWGSTQANAEDTIGIGPYFCHVEAADKKVADYTLGTTSKGNQEANVASSAYSVRRLEIWAALEDFTPQHGLWIGAGLDGDFDNAANWEDGRVPAVGENIDFSATAPNTTISVTGASAGRKFGTATMGASVVTFTGNIAFAGITDTSKIAVGSNSTVTLDGHLGFSGNGDQYVVNTVAASGRFVVTGDIIAKEDFTGYLFHSKTCGVGAVQARGLVNNATGNSDTWAFRINAEDGTGTANWIIGDHGLSGSRHFWINGSRPVEIRPFNSGFTISANVGNNADITFNTTGVDGDPYTITISDGTKGHFERTGALKVTGAGKVLVNAVNTYQGNVNVTDTATLAVNPGKKMTTGLITVANGAMLEVAQSGTVTLEGDLALANDAVLAFNFTDRNVPKLGIASGKSVTASGPVKVKITAAKGVRPKSGEKVLTSCGGFADKTVTLVEGYPNWVKGVRVNDEGNIVLDAKAGFMVIVR